MSLPSSEGIQMFGIYIKKLIFIIPLLFSIMKKFNENFTNYELFKLNSRAAIRHLKNWFKSDLINKFSLINKMSLINKIPIIPINFISKFNIFKFIKLLLKINPFYILSWIIKIIALINMLFGVGVVLAYNFNPIDIVNGLIDIYQNFYQFIYNFYQNSIKEIIHQLSKLLNNVSDTIPDSNDDPISSPTITLIDDSYTNIKPGDPGDPGDSSNYYYFKSPYFYVPVITIITVVATYYFYNDLTDLLSPNIPNKDLPNIITDLNTSNSLLDSDLTPSDASDKLTPSNYDKLFRSKTNLDELNEAFKSSGYTPSSSPTLSDASTIGKGKGKA
jgi:hypothetical protein